MPQSLPLFQGLAIEAIFALQRRSVDGKHGRLTDKARKRKWAVQRDHDDRRVALKGKLAADIHSIEARRADLDRAKADAQKDLSTAQAEAATLERQLAAYQNITFKSYARRLLSFSP
jgi:chromosome segregation ATPase